MLSLNLGATKRAIYFGGKKNSSFFARFIAKLISFRRCNQEKGNEWVDRKQFLFHLSANLGHILDLRKHPNVIQRNEVSTITAILLALVSTFSHHGGQCLFTAAPSTKYI